MLQDYLNVKDGRIFYAVSGKGNPVVLLHGNFNDHRIWSGQADFFSADYQLVRYDLRGYGQSSTPNSPFSNVDDLKRLADSLNLQKLILIGSSSGGGAAVDFALTYPHLVQALILVCPSVNGNPYPLKLVWQGMKNFINVRLKGREKAIESFMANPFWAYFFPSPVKKEARETVIQQVRNPRNFCRFSPNLSTAVKPHAIHRLREIQAPTLIIITDQDHPYNIKTAELLHKNLKRSSLICMQNCGHLPFVEEPETFNRTVHDFLRHNCECD